MNSHRTAALAFALALSGSAVGCRGGHWWGPPGPLQQQQSSAVVHDPYPQQDIGPRELGARPPDYQRPLPEPVRNRIYYDSMPWVGP